MRIGFLVAPDASSRIAEALGRHANLLLAKDADEFIAVLGRHPNCAVVDPSLVPPELTPLVADALTEGSIPFVIYVPLSAERMEAALPFARAGAWAIITPGYSDSSEQIRHVFRGLSQRGLSGLLLDCLEEHLKLLPEALERGISDLFYEPGRGVSPAVLARQAGLTRRSVDRWLQRAGLASASRMIAASHVVNAYAFIRSSSRTIRSVAQSLGYSSRRPLDKHAMNLVGASLEAMREGMPAEVVVDALADALIVEAAQKKRRA